MKLIMTRGLPASGKSTWAKEQVEKGKGRVKRINKDDLRAMIHGGWTRGQEPSILRARNALVSTFLIDGFDVIVDDTNFAPEHEEQLRLFAITNGAEFEIKDFDTPVSVCIERDPFRSAPVGAKVIRDMWLKYIVQPAPKYKPELLDVILCDIDGTLAHMDGRGPYDWSRVGEDKPDATVSDILVRYYGKARIVLLSGRDGSCRPETETWLSDSAIPYQELYMRAADDNRKDYVIKRELYEQKIKGNYNVLFVLDDRDQVVDLWRELGLKCLQVASGTF